MERVVCTTCEGIGTISGRVDYYRWRTAAEWSAATSGPRIDYYTEGNAIPCPECHPDAARLYGHNVRVTFSDRNSD